MWVQQFSIHSNVLLIFCNIILSFVLDQSIALSGNV